MSHEVKIPMVGESVTSGTLAQWHVAEGEEVQVGQTLFSLETDKITQEIEAEYAGVISLLVAEGEEVEIGVVVAQIASQIASQGSDSAAPESGQPSTPQAEAAEQSEQSEQSTSSAPSESSSSSTISSPSAEAREEDVVVPPVGESVSTGTLAAWLVEEGAQVEVGQILFSLETDKITQEIESEYSGTLARLVEEGAEVEIGAVVGRIATSVGGGVAELAQTKPDSSEEKTDAIKTPADPSSAQAIPAQISKTLAASAEKMREQQSEKTVLPANVASLHKVNQPATTTPALTEEALQGRTTRKKMTQLRRKIARHLVNAQHEAAILTTFNEVDMTAVMKLRKELQEGFVARYGIKLGFMSFFVKAVTEALKIVPQVNAQIEGDEIIENHFYDIGCAIGTPKGLVVPVLRDCDQKSFADIEKDILNYAERAKAGKLDLADLQGGVFTISNGGVYGSLLSTPILNPPQSGILGMHTIQKRPVVVNDEIVIRPMMYLALSYDHRLVDGKEAVTFLIRIKECLEQPARLLIEA